MLETDRLNGIHSFSPEILDVVGEAADRFRGSFSTWPGLLNYMQRDRDITVTRQDGGLHGAIDVLKIDPPERDWTMAYHLPMGNTVNENILTRIFVLSEVLPYTTIVAAGNPGAPGCRSGLLANRFRSSVAGGDFSETVAPLLKHTHDLVSQESVDPHVAQVGFSYGADRAVAAATYASNYDLNSQRVVPMEPASAQRRNLLRLGLDFKRSEAALEGYVAASMLKSYEDARQIASAKERGDIGYGLGLARLTNIAISRGIASGQFVDAMHILHGRNPDSKVSLIWGTESELADDETMRMIVDDVNNVEGIPVIGQKHAMGDDIFLHAALVLEGLKQASN